MTENNNIPAPERSKEETGVNGSLITPHMLNAGSAQITVPSYDADDKKTLAVRVYRAMEAARLSSVLETPPLHKEGEIVGRSFLDELENKSGRKLYAAPVPVPVTITDDMVDAAHSVIEKSFQSEPWVAGPPSLLARAALTAALSQKPGEQG